jgi:hypothetical protein
MTRRHTSTPLTRSREDWNILLDVCAWSLGNWKIKAIGLWFNLGERGRGDLAEGKMKSFAFLMNIAGGQGAFLE